MRPVTVTATAEPYRVQALTQQHVWFGDEPTDLGGGDTAPAPFELLLSAVGACTTITVQMYARRKEWPLEGVRVDLQFEKGKGAEPSRIQLRLELSGDLTTEQRERLLDIAGKCPVKRAIEGELVFTSTLGGDA